MAFKMKMKEYGKGKNPIQFNEGLRKASAEGKLDDNPKFKATVDKSPVQLKVKPTHEGGYGKKHDKLRAKGHKARAAADEAFDAGKKKKTERLDRRADKKLGKARDIRVKASESPAKFLGMGRSPSEKAKAGGPGIKGIGKALLNPAGAIANKMGLGDTAVGKALNPLGNLFGRPK